MTFLNQRMKTITGIVITLKLTSVAMRTAMMSRTSTAELAADIASLTRRLREKKMSRRRRSMMKRQTSEYDCLSLF
jgi:hypothetical protein